MSENYKNACKWAVAHKWSIDAKDFMSILTTILTSKNPDRIEVAMAILEECNFHTEVKLICEGKYGAALDHYMSNYN